MNEEIDLSVLTVIVNGIRQSKGVKDEIRVLNAVKLHLERQDNQPIDWSKTYPMLDAIVTLGKGGIAHAQYLQRRGSFAIQARAYGNNHPLKYWSRLYPGRLP